MAMRYRATMARGLAAMLVAIGLAGCSATESGQAPGGDETSEREVDASAPAAGDATGDAGSAETPSRRDDSAAMADGGGLDDISPDGSDSSAMSGRGPASQPDPIAGPSRPGTTEELVVEAPAACSVAGMNDFGWPPPEPSAKVTIPRALLLAGVSDENETLGTVGARLEAALIDAGYVEYGYQSIGCSGFAMVTRMERIDETGRPVEGEMRFAPPDARPDWSLTSYLQRLFFAPPGRYRQIVFAATDRAYDRDRLADAPTRDELEEMMAAADVTALPEGMLERAFTRSHALHALIYEFKKGQADRDVVQLKPSDLGGATHIQAAGIYSSLGNE